MEQTEVYLEAIREKVCSVCLTTDEADGCSVDFRKACAVERFLPQIVDVASSAEGERIEDYISALRESVCSTCRPEGETDCSIRDNNTCGLERYFVLIVEAIQEVKSKEASAAS